jgi:hypothetical protein
VQATQTLLVVSHLGVVPEQLPSPVHCTQVKLELQTRDEAQATVPEHWPQVPSVSHAGLVES